VCVREYYHDSPPLIIAHLKPEAPAIARFLHTNHQKGTDRSKALTLCCLRLVSLQVLSAPYLKNNGHHQVPHLKVGASTSVHCVSVHASCMHACSPFHCDGSWYLLNCSSVLMALYACVRACLWFQSSSPDKSNKDDNSHAGEVSLKGRGLCLVPISSTFAVASEVPVDFVWSTPFAANFR